MPLSARIKASIEADLTRSIDLAGAASRLHRVLSIALSDGTVANQADRVWHDQRTLGPSASEEIDVAGSLTDIYGQAVTLARLKALMILPAAANLNNINVSRPASNGVPIYLAASDGEVVHPGGILLKVWPGAIYPRDRRHRRSHIYSQRRGHEQRDL